MVIIIGGGYDSVGICTVDGNTWLIAHVSSNPDIHATASGRQCDVSYLCNHEVSVVGRSSIENHLGGKERKAGARSAGRSSICGPRGRLRNNVHVYRVRVKDIVVSISRILLLANLLRPIARKWSVRVYPKLRLECQESR